MARDPAFLFYYTAFGDGTKYMTDEEVGCYVRLLCEQADKGFITPKIFNRIIHDRATIKEAILEKFKVDDAGNYFNERLREEQIKRKKYTEGRIKNFDMGKHKDSHKERDTENHTKDINKDININLSNRGNGKGEIVKYAQLFPNRFIDSEFEEHWNKWIEFNEERGTPITPIQAKEQLKYLNGIENPIEQIELSIKNNWKGLDYGVNKKNGTRPNIITSEEIRNDRRKMFQ